MSPALAGRFFTTELPQKPIYSVYTCMCFCLYMFTHTCMHVEKKNHKTNVIKHQWVSSRNLGERFMRVHWAFLTKKIHIILKEIMQKIRRRICRYHVYDVILGTRELTVLSPFLLLIVMTEFWWKSGWGYWWNKHFYRGLENSSALPPGKREHGLLTQGPAGRQGLPLWRLWRHSPHHRCQTWHCGQYTQGDPPLSHSVGVYGAQLTAAWRLLSGNFHADFFSYMSAVKLSFWFLWIFYFNLNDYFQG